MTLQNINFLLLSMPHSLKLPYTENRVPSLVFFSGEVGRLFQILSLRRGANSKPGAYLKLGANSSIHGMYFYKNTLLIYVKRIHFNTKTMANNLLVGKRM